MALVRSYHCAMNTPLEQPAWAEFTHTLLTSRQTILPKRLGSPGPDAQQQRRLFEAAAAAPDHGELRPWRFVVIAAQRRAELGQAFALALLERDPKASPAELAQAHEKALRAPFLAVAIARLGDIGPANDPELVVDAHERLISLGAALQNMLLAAHGMGLGSSLTSGLAMRSAALGAFLQLAPGEQAICCLNVGTVLRSRSLRVRPDPADFVQTLA